jgi:hypothetical protein
MQVFRTVQNQSAVFGARLAIAKTSHPPTIHPGAVKASCNPHMFASMLRSMSGCSALYLGPAGGLRREAGDRAVRQVLGQGGRDAS